MFTLSHATLRRLFSSNFIEVPNATGVLLGLRGCLPTNCDNYAFTPTRDMNLEETNYRNPRCSLVIWRLADNNLAVFPGSTVPHQKHISESIAANGSGTNQLFTGYYQDYRKGTHRAGRPTAHPALQQSRAAPLRRTSDDTDYDEDDFAEIELAGDNIHAAWTGGVDESTFESAGCQVIVGYPACEKRGAEPATGAWAAFWSALSGFPQESFNYLLIQGREAQTAALAAVGEVSARLRFGSQGPLVETLQRRLQERGYYEGAIDQDFGPRTFRALIRYQKATFIRGGDDGVFGPQTAESLGIQLPKQ